MSFQGRMAKGVVVFDEPVALPDGTPVRVEPVAEVNNVEHMQSMASAASHGGSVDCLTTATALARDLGNDFSSQDPHTLAGRGDGWFGPS